MSLFPEGNGLNKNHRDDPGIWSTTPEFGSKRTPHLRSTVPNVQRHMAYFALVMETEPVSGCTGPARGGGRVKRKPNIIDTGASAASASGP